MEINSFRVRKYRSVEDSGEIEIADQLTCIVGKEPVGKDGLVACIA